MGAPFIGEIRIFFGNFAPAGWALCNGQTMAISENETLFNLIGTTYGGDGQTTFNLPDLQGRVPIHPGNGFVFAETGGSESVTLTTSQIPAHSHGAACNSAAGTSASPTGGFWAGEADTAIKPYTNTPFSSTNPAANMNSLIVGSAGGSQPHDNMLPFLTVNFIISLFGIFPSQN